MSDSTLASAGNFAAKFSRSLLGEGDLFTFDLRNYDGKSFRGAKLDANAVDVTSNRIKQVIDQ